MMNCESLLERSEQSSSKLSLTDINEDLAIQIKNVLREKDFNSFRRHSEEIFRQIRLFALSNDSAQRNK